MISRQDILDRAAEWRLRPEIVEKDYVLGWLLAGLASLPARAQWIFKGGTCIKKCFFETYRFSEDLDFSLLPEAPYGEEELRAGLLALARTTHELSGITFPEDLVAVRPRQNRQGQRTYECRVAYRGPLAYPGDPRRVLFDLTRACELHDRARCQPVACSVALSSCSSSEEGTAKNASRG